MKYLAKQVYCYSEEDSFNCGTEGQTFDKTYNMEFVGESIEEVKNKIKSFHDFDSLSNDDGLYVGAVLENKEGFIASEKEIELWKDERERLFYVSTAYKIYRMEPIQ